MELLAGAAAAAWGGGELFSYNRENYMFDKELLMKRDYQAQKMRVKKAELYREDVRDLVQLTVRKMDNYLVVSTLQLGFCMTLYVEGRPKPGIGLPHWLMHLFAMCNAGAFLYYLLSIWLSMHASVAAHAFGVRLLTQVVRLPIPDDATLDKSRFKAQQYEGNKVKEMFRVPLLQQQIQRFTQAMDKTDEEDREDRMSTSGASVTNSDDEDVDESNMMVVDLPHIRHFRRIQAHWQAYDAYARVCMAMGTNQLLHTLSYMMLGTLVAENDVPFPAFSCVVIFTACAWVLARLDLYLSRRILAVAGFLLVLPPAIVTLSFSLHRGFSKVPQPMTHLATVVYRVLVPLAFFFHILWIIFTLFVGKAKKRGSGIDMALPTTFRSVLFLDVFGWLAEESDQDDLDEEPTFVLDEGGEEEEPIQRQLSRVSEGPEAAQEELPPEALQGAIVVCRQLRARLAKDLERFESDDVQAMLSEDVRDIRRLRREFDHLCATFTEAEETLPASSSSGEVSQLEVQPEDSEPVWVRVDLESHGRMIQVFQNCEEGRCLCEEPPVSGRILDILGLRAEIARFSEQIGTIRRQRRQRSRTRSRPTLNDDAMDAQNMDLTFHPRAQSAPQVFDPEEEEEERRRAERSRLTTTGRMPWRTVKLGSLVLIGAWAISLVWIIAFISFEALHGHNTSTFDDTLSAGAMSDHGGALLQHLGHNQHKVTFALSTGELVNIQNWPTAFARPVDLACHRDFGALMVLEKYAVHVLQEANGTATKDAHLLQDNIDRCIFGETDFQGQGIRSFSLQCEAVEHCSLWLLAENGHQLLRCPLSPLGPAEMMELKGGPWRAVQIQSHQELWAWRKMGALDDERDQIVLLRRACHQQCDFLPRRDLDVPSLSIDFLLHWPGVPWLFASSRKEDLMRGFYLDADEMPMVKFIELHQPPRRSLDERWLGGCVGNRSLYVLEDLGQSADQRLRIVRRSLDNLRKTSLSP